MKSLAVRLAFALLAVCLLVGAGASSAEAHPRARTQEKGFVQPFLITFNRHELLVIAFIEGHPEYDAVEVMVTRRAGQPPLLRVILTLHDGSQADHHNDAEIARERAAVLTNRVSVFRPILFEESRVDGLPVVRLRFTSYQGEEVFLSFVSFNAPVPEAGGFINPGNHSMDTSLPVMWADASAFASPESRVVIDGVSHPLRPGFVPGTRFGFYLDGFQIGLISEGNLRLWQLWHPRSLTPGEKWLYWDQLGNLHVYEIIGVEGDLVTVHKTSTSAFLPEEVITARLEKGRLRLRSVRATARTGLRCTPPPPPPQGVTLELSEEGGFSLSIDEHEDLVTGTASREVRGATTTWTLQPLEPPWTRSRTVRASVSRHGLRYFIENVIGEE